MPKTKTKAATGSIHAVVGSDEAEIKRVAGDLATKLTPPEAGDFGLEVIDGAADNAEQAATRIRSTIEALRSVQSALEELTDLINADLGPGVVLLISAIDVDKRRSFYKSLARRAELQVIDRLDATRTGWEEEATEIVRNRAQKQKLQFDDDALHLFVLLTGGDTRQIDNELEKIDVFLGGGTGILPVRQWGVSPPRVSGASPTVATAMPRVDVDLVRELVPLSRAGVIFELGNALAARDLRRAARASVRDETID